MKHLVAFLLILVLAVNSLQAQNINNKKSYLNRQEKIEVYNKSKQQRYKSYREKQKAKFDNFRDSLNKQYALYLETQWEKFKLQHNEPPIKTPFVTPPIFGLGKTLTPKKTIIPIQTIEKNKQPISIPKTQYSVKPQQEIEMVDTEFFGTNISIAEIDNMPSLYNTSESNVSAYWSDLSKMNKYEYIIADINCYKNSLSLNDWGIYLLLGKIYETYCPDGNNNEQVIFTVFMLNQMGYKAKIGRNNNDLYSLISFSNNVTNSTYFTFNKSRYYVMNPQHKDLSNIECCSMDYKSNLNQMNIDILETPLFEHTPLTIRRDFKGKQYTFTINKNLIDYYKSYPCIDFHSYARAPIEKGLLESIKNQLYTELANKNQEDAVNWILHFIQNAFKYKTDKEQFGYEKFNFIEETLASQYCDCEDRAILFSHLVKNFLNLPVVLIYYRGLHLATAVKFKDTSISGDYVEYNGEKYIICDPTYINANAGNAMPLNAQNGIEIWRID